MDRICATHLRTHCPTQVVEPMGEKKTAEVAESGGSDSQVLWEPVHSKSELTCFATYVRAGAPGARARARPKPLTRGTRKIPDMDRGGRAGVGAEQKTRMPHSYGLQ